MNKSNLFKALQSIHYTNNVNTRIPHIKIDDAKEIMWQIFSDILARVEGKKAHYIPAYDDIADWLTDNKRQGLLLMGSTGLGKTLICSKVIPTILRAINMNDRGEFTTPPIRTYKAIDLERVYEDNDKTAPMNQQTIIIEDVGTEERCSNYGNKYYAFPRLVDEAETRNRLLIITTNLNDEELQQRYNPRTWSRLKHLCRIVVFDEARDFRKEASIYTNYHNDLSEYAPPPQI